MATIPFKALMGIPAISTYLLVEFKPELLLFSHPTYLGTYVQLFTIQFIAWAFWTVLLYPAFFSPLRHLPMPSGGSWWNGHWKVITESASGEPMIHWYIPLNITNAIISLTR